MAEADKHIRDMEQALRREYAIAKKEMDEKLKRQMKAFETLDQKKQSQVAKGKLDQAAYEKWRKGQLLHSKWMKDMIKSYSDLQVKTNKVASEIINSRLGTLFDNAFSNGASEIVSKTGIDFALHNDKAVKRLADKKNELLPKSKVDVPKDKRWNQNKMRSALTQGVLQGESIDKIAGRLRDVTDMNRRAAMRNARTMANSAENAGLYESYLEAAEKGVPIVKMWQAALDSRTRSSHRHLDGVTVDIRDRFDNGLLYPCDTDGRPEEVYNCRCRLSCQILGFERNMSDLANRNTDHFNYESYEDWGKGITSYQGNAKVLKGNKSTGRSSNGNGTVYPIELAGYKKGKPMSHPKADGGKVNPGYGKLNSGDPLEIYEKNCQTCVVCYEARRRGYNVEALGRAYELDLKGGVIFPPDSMQSKIAKDLTLPWIDPKTGAAPIMERTQCKSHGSMVKYLNNNVEVGKRYVFAFSRKDGTSHVLNLEKTSKGVVRLYDAQTDELYEGDAWIDAYLKHNKVQYKKRGVDKSPRVLRVDHLNIDEKVLKEISTNA